MKKKTTKIRLKPCPFCGNKNIHITDAWPHYAYCLKCGATVKRTPYGYGTDGIERAAERWNRRDHWWNKTGKL